MRVAVSRSTEADRRRDAPDSPGAVFLSKRREKCWAGTCRLGAAGGTEHPSLGSKLGARRFDPSCKGEIRKAATSAGLQRVAHPSLAAVNRGAGQAPLSPRRCSAVEPHPYRACSKGRREPRRPSTSVPCCRSALMHSQRTATWLLDIEQPGRVGACRNLAI